MKLIFTLSAIFFSLTLGVFEVSAADQLKAVDITTIKKEIQSVTAFNGEIKISGINNSITRNVDVVFRALIPGDDSSLHLPSEYTPISNVIEYVLVDRGALAVKKSVEVVMTYSSDLRFSKFVFVYNEKKKQWNEIKSETDVNNKTVKFSLTQPNATLVVADTHFMEYGKASWYRYKKCMCAASPDYPKGTQLLVVNQNKNNESVVVKVNDWGPERDIFPDRVIDLDVVAFEKLLTRRAGILNNIRVIPFHVGELDAEKEKNLLSGEVVALSDDELKKIRNGVVEIKDEIAVLPMEDVAVQPTVTPKYYFLD